MQSTTTSVAVMMVRSRNLDLPRYLVMTITIGNSSSVRNGEGIAVTERFSLQMTWEALLQIFVVHNDCFGVVLIF